VTGRVTVLRGRHSVRLTMRRVRQGLHLYDRGRRVIVGRLLHTRLGFYEFVQILKATFQSVAVIVSRSSRSVG
jgi:hypothetical protein